MKSHKGSVLGSVLKLELYNFFINDLILGLNSVLTRLTTDSKLFAMVKAMVDCEELLEDPFKLGEWQMTFNIGKCKVIHNRTAKS